MTDRPEGRPPTDHPEAFCQRCKRPNIVWFAQSELWNRVMRQPGVTEGIVCPVCFVQAAERAGIKPSSWEVRPDGAMYPMGDLGGAPRGEPGRAAALRASGWVELLFGVRNDLASMLRNEKLSVVGKEAATLWVADIDAALAAVRPA